MTEIIAHKIFQMALVFIGFVAFIVAQIEENYSVGISPFEEAAKYGFAVLVLFIVLYFMYKDYQHEKEYSKEEIKNLNNIIIKMAETNRQAIDRSSQSMEQQNKINEKILMVVEQMQREVSRG